MRDLVRGLPEPKHSSDREPRKVGVVKIGVHGDRISIFWTPVSWMEFQVLTSDKRDLVPQKERFHRLAVSCLVISGDYRQPNEKLILAKRSQQVELYKNLWHVSAAGYVEANDMGRIGGLDIPITSLDRELKEEMNLRCEWARLASIDIITACEHLEHPIYELCTVIRVDTPYDILLDKARSAKDTWEGKHHAFSRREVAHMLKTEMFNPAGAATILSYLQL